MAGAIFGDFGGWLPPRTVNDVSCVTPINHESHFFVAGAIFGDVRG